MNELPPAAHADRRRKRRRRLGLSLLIGAIVLVLAGQTVLEPHLNGVNFPLFWSACFLFVVLALFTALADFAAIRRDAARERMRLAQETFGRAKPGTDDKEHVERDDD